MLHGSQTEAEARSVVELIKFKDPNGIAGEAYYGPLTCINVPLKSPRANARSIVSNMGLGHITLGMSPSALSCAMTARLLAGSPTQLLSF